MQKVMLDTLTGLKEEVNYLKKDIHYIKECLEDKKLTVEEKKILDESIAKVKSGDQLDVVSHNDLKKELGF